MAARENEKFLASQRNKVTALIDGPNYGRNETVYLTHHTDLSGYPTDNEDYATYLQTLEADLETNPVFEYDGVRGMDINTTTKVFATNKPDIFMTAETEHDSKTGEITVSKLLVRDLGGHSYGLKILKKNHPNGQEIR
jgi:hypothetical protein